MIENPAVQFTLDAKAGEYDYFTTTLSISPLKNAAKLNEIGQRLGKEYGVPLPEYEKAAARFHEQGLK